MTEEKQAKLVEVHPQLANCDQAKAWEQKLTDLPPSHQDVLRLSGALKTHKEIANKLFLAPETPSKYIRRAAMAVLPEPQATNRDLIKLFIFLQAPGLATTEDLAQFRLVPTPDIANHFGLIA